MQMAELASESIPGCVLQIFVLITKIGTSSAGAIVSIGISTLTTGYASAMVAFDMDLDVGARKNQPQFYGCIPDDHTLRGRCFILMTLMNALHNFSRSIGYAMLAESGGLTMVWSFAGCEMIIFLAWKILRGDFYYWVPVEGALGVLASFIERVASKVIVDFCGCLNFRHPCELGGTAFTLSMLWAQAMPFVALLLYKKKKGGDDDDGKAVGINGNFNITNSTSLLPNDSGNVESENGGELEKSTITIVLTCSFILWLLTNVAFFCTIDLTYLHTFWGTMTAPQFTCKRFKDASEDSVRFDAAFLNRKSYTKTINLEIKEWVAVNVDRWREENPEWFDIQRIPDEFLPPQVVVSEGGASRRRRSSVSLRELVGGSESK